MGSSLKIMAPLRQRIARMYAQPTYVSLFSIGVLNGLLPCGLVYAALAVAVAGGSIVTSSLFMAAFGAGTLPMMWMVAFFAGSLKLSFRSSLRKVYPYIIFVMACILILRGLNLGIPFISPGLHEGHNHVEGIQCHD
jgi:sulfite exporter TauE/SafE